MSSVRALAPVVALLLLLALCGGVERAGAASLPSLWLRYGDAIEHAWPGSRCDGRVAVDAAGDAAIDAAYASASYGIAKASMIGGLAVGMADGSCRIAIRAEAKDNPEVWCVIAVHEAGHLAGLPHSTDPANVMAPVARSGSWPACRPPSPRYHRRARRTS